MRPYIASALVLSALLLTGVAPPSVAQTVPWPQTIATPYGQPTLTTGDVHRYEMDRLRAQADQNQALAQSQAMQTQATIQTLQAQRQPPLILPEAARPMTLEQARRARAATEARGAASARSMGQIDSWLDRRPQ